MSVTQQAIANYLDEQFSGLAAAIGQSTVPTLGYEPDIRNAFRKLGKTESELDDATAENSQRDVVFALAKYFAAQRLWQHFGVFVNSKVDDSQYDYKQAQLNAQIMMKDAERLCAGLGYEIVPTGTSVITPDSVRIDTLAVW
jgi:hypothetical protein